MTNFGRYNQSKSANFIVPFHCLEYKLDLKQSSCHEAINHLVRLKRCVTLDLRNNFFSQLTSSTQDTLYVFSPLQCQRFNCFNHDKSVARQLYMFKVSFRLVKVIYIQISRVKVTWLQTNIEQEMKELIMHACKLL